MCCCHRTWNCAQPPGSLFGTALWSLPDELWWYDNIAGYSINTSNMLPTLIRFEYSANILIIKKKSDMFCSKSMKRYYWLPKKDQKNIVEPKFQIIKLFIIISISFADSGGVCPKGQIFHLFSIHYSRLTHLLNIGFLVLFIRLNHNNTCNVKTLVPLVL